MKTLSRFVSLGVLAAVPLAADVVVRTDVPFGNAANVRVEAGGGETVVRFTPDPHGGPERLWFCFRVDRAPAAPAAALGRLRMILECPETMLGGGNPGSFRPVYRMSGGDWARAGEPQLIELSDGRRQAVWTLEAAGPTMDFAFSYPYGHENVDRLIAETEGYWRADTIGVSQGGRPLVRLSNDVGRPKGDRPGLYLMARQHSGEVGGSWVMDGVLRRLAELGEAAPLVWAAPLANIDGVEQGDYGKDNFPYDLNRAWGRPPMRHEVLAFQQDMRRWAQRCRAVVGIDFHSPGASETQGIYTFVNPSPPDVAERARLWADRLAGGLGEAFASTNFIRTALYASRWETPRFSTFCHEQLALPALALEVPYAIAHNTVMTREAYQEAGRRIADVLAGDAGDASAP